MIKGRQIQKRRSGKKNSKVESSNRVEASTVEYEYNREKQNIGELMKVERSKV